MYIWKILPLQQVHILQHTAGTQQEKPTEKTATVCEYMGDMTPSCV